MKLSIYKQFKLLSCSFLFTCSSLFSESVSTDPVGYVTWTINPGSGTSRAFTSLALPLYQPSQSVDGVASGVINSVTSNAITVLNAGWSPSQFSNSSSPFCLRITSGSAEGRTLLISTSTDNTDDTVTIDLVASNITDLINLNIVANDKFEIIECDTLGSLFGNPSENGIIGAESFSEADNMYLSSNGSWSRFYYNNSLGRWTKLTLGSPDATNQPVLPDDGILYSRLAPISTDLVLSGTVPDTPRQLTINQSGVTVIGSAWPVDIELSNSGISQISEWKSSASPSTADRVYILVSGSWQRFYYDGLNWRKITLGNPTADNQTISSGSAVVLQKFSPSSLDGVLFQDVPYSL